MSDIELAYQLAVEYGEPMLITPDLLPALGDSPDAVYDGKRWRYKGIVVKVDTGDDDDLLNNDPPGSITIWRP